MIFIPKGPWFTGDKHETRTCELVGPHAHAFIQAIHVAWKEVVPHVCPPHLNHLRVLGGMASDPSSPSSKGSLCRLVPSPGTVDGSCISSSKKDSSGP